MKIILKESDIVRFWKNVDKASSLTGCWLWLGTNMENVMDMDLNNRRGKVVGELQGRSKLTAKEVIKIRAAYSSGGLSYKKIGIEYGVNATAVFKIVSRKRLLRAWEKTIV